MGHQKSDIRSLIFVHDLCLVDSNVQLWTAGLLADISLGRDYWVWHPSDDEIPESNPWAEDEFTVGLSSDKNRMFVDSASNLWYGGNEMELHGSICEIDITN